ncbi:MAG: GNAT family N-acetyltransferase [candidate division Zixibacteria bacterium]
MDIEVRLAGKEDTDKIHSILEEIQGCEQDLRGKRFTEALNSNFSHFLIAVTDDKIIGYLNLWNLPDLVDGEFLGIILDCYVSGKYRSRGVGRMLLDACMDLGHKLKINKFYGWMDPDNRPAITLLKRCGFATSSLMLEKN